MQWQFQSSLQERGLVIEHTTGHFHREALSADPGGRKEREVFIEFAIGKFNKLSAPQSKEHQGVSRKFAVANFLEDKPLRSRMFALTKKFIENNISLASRWDTSYLRLNNSCKKSMLSQSISRSREVL